MGWLRVIALTLLVTFPPAVFGQGTGGGAQPAPSTSSGPKFNAPAPAPPKSAPLLWCYGTSATPDCKSGRWYSDAQVENIAKNIWFLEDRIAKQNVEMERTKADASLADARAGLGIPKWVWITTGVVVGAAVGVGVGWYIWKRNDSDPAPAPATTAVMQGPGISAAW